MKCAICKKPIVELDYKPFCSNRCQLIDLHSWFTESYSIKAEEQDEISEEDIQKLEEALLKEEQ